MTSQRLLAGLFAVAATASRSAAQVTGDVPARGNPVAIVDLRTTAGASLVRARWRTMDARIVDVDHHLPGPDLRASGAPNRTHDLEPHAGVAGFDDASWPVIAPESLEARRGGGRLSYTWYRTTVTLPERIGDEPVAGHAIVFEVVVDDYAEISVDGRQPLVLGQTGGAVAKGFNAPNRVLLTNDARPGQRFTIALLGTNGPLSLPPANFIWVRSATLDVYRAGQVGGVTAAGGHIVRLDPGLDDLIEPAAKIEQLAGGFQFTEGPVWIADAGHLLFSDPNANMIYRWAPDGQVSVFRTKSGYTGADIGRYHQPGSNGLTLDPAGLLTINEHGNRRVTRLERTGAITVLADRFEGKRLNSPNDLVYRSDGTLFFTDPPFGLPKVFDDPAKELGFSGVYAVKDGRVRLLTKELTGPNGIAFSPDEKQLYVDTWDVRHKVVMRYDVASDGTLANGIVFLDLTSEPGDADIAMDGIKVDVRGNVYVSGPLGIWIVAPDGRRLGRIETPEHDANLAWGDADRRTLFLTASSGLYRLRMKVAGAGAFAKPDAPSP